MHVLGTLSVLFTQYYKVYTQMRMKLVGHAGRTLRETIHTRFGSVKLTERDNLEDIGVYEKIITDCTLNKQGVML